jgi:hypothetical protein
MLRTRKCWVTVLTLGAACVAGPARAADIDKLTPADAQAVMVFNIRQAFDSPLAKKKGIVDLVKAGIDGNPQAKQVLAAVGLDPTKDIESVTVAVGNFADFQPNAKPEKMLAILRGNFDPDRIEAAVKKVDTITVSKEGNTTVYEFKDKDKGDTVHFTLIGKSIVAASPSKDYLLKSVKNIGGGSKDLVKAAKKLDPKQCMWMAIGITDDMRKEMAKNPQFKAFAEKLESITFGIHVSDAIIFDLNVNTSDAEAPKAMKVQVDQAVQLFKAFGGADEKAGPIITDILNSLKITANQDALNFNLKVTEAMLDKIIKLAQMK